MNVFKSKSICFKMLSKKLLKIFAIEEGKISQMPFFKAEKLIV